MSASPAGVVEIRSKNEGVQVVDVSFPKRIIEVVAMPYEQETIVEYRGRMVRESCARGAFDGIERRPNRVNVNRDHDISRQVGKALTFHPSREEGLVAELLIGKTDLGNETLALAAEGMLDASAGFLPIERRDGKPGEEWPERNRRRLTWLWLDHIAMVPDPAYDSARTLAVRHEDDPTPPAGEVVVATPNLDRVRAIRLEDQYSRLSR
jgi:phage head maturation protease